MPTIFSSSDDFAEWFNVGDNTKDQKMNIDSVQKMHRILRPFMLRRTKKDLATKLPDKIEINVKVHLTPM
jgi:SNF2 family DNA or RNA helicase